MVGRRSTQTPAYPLVASPRRARNVIAGNNNGGISFVGAGSNSGSVQGNFIGLDRTGLAAIPGSAYGVFVGDGDRVFLTGESDARGITIGGSVAGAGNVIAGHTGAGVWIAGADSTGNTIAGNLIGTNSLGLTSVANQVGILISHGASNNLIGGITSTARNLISGNATAGVSIQGTVRSTILSKGTGSEPTFPVHWRLEMVLTELRCLVEQATR